jgi:hypothetical protein
MENGKALGLSTIQQSIMEIETLDRFKNNIKSFLGKYDTENIIIARAGSSMYEVTEGYLDITFETSDLDELMENMRVEHSVQIKGLEKENRIYRLGVVKQTLNECESNNQVVNIKSLTDLL